jgi:hypothetical protein
MGRSYQTGQWQCCLNLINAPKLDSAVELWSIDQVKLASTLLSSDFSTFPTHSHHFMRCHLQCLKSLLLCAFFYSCRDCLKLELNWIVCNL